ncbi:MAG: porin [Rhodobacteraceae bacterium]|nr:porin [Paracoccaceae bacterium]
MKNVLLTTTALVIFAGAASAEVSLSAGADLGYNDLVNGGLFYDVNIDLTGTFDLGDGYAATISYGFDFDNSGGLAYPVPWSGASTASFDTFPTIEITSPYGSLKGGDLGDKGASEYFYKDRDGMAIDAENHDSSTRFDVRALVEFGNIGLAVGGAGDGAGGIDGLSVGAGTTFGNITVALAYDEADAALAGDTVLATTGVSLDTTVGGASIGLSYISDTVDTSTGVAVGFDVSADLSVGVYYANNSGGDDMYGVTAAYTMGALALDVYYDSGNGATVDTMGLNVSYDIMADLTGYAGVYNDSLTSVFYVGAVYAINDNLTATVSYADANEIDGPDFKDGTTVMLSASF